MNAKHQETFEWLQKGQDGSLSPSDAQKLRAHLEDCPACLADAHLQRRLATGLFTKASQMKLPGRSNDQMIAAVQRAVRRQNRRRVTLQWAAWAAASLMLIVLMSWTIDSLRPGAVGSLIAPAPGAGNNFQSLFSSLSINPLLPSLPEASHFLPAAPIDWMLFLYNNIFYLSLLPVLLFTLAGMFLNQRDLQVLWLGILLIGLAAGVILQLYVAKFSLYSSTIFFSLAILIFTIGVLPMLILQVWEERRYWSPQIWLLISVFIIVMLVILFAASWQYQKNVYPVFTYALVLLLFAMVMAIPWVLADWKPVGRWLLAFLTGLFIVDLTIAFLATPNYTFTAGSWQDTVVSLSMIFGPIIAAVLSARLLLAWFSSPQPWPRLKMLLAIVCFGLVFTIIFASLRLLAIRTSINEDPIAGIAAWTFVALAGCIAAATGVKKLNGWRIWGYALVTAVFVMALLPSVSIKPGLGMQLTEQRVAQVNQAILKFHQQTGRYPDSLNELVPGYLWRIPEPVTYLQSVWCYDGGPTYYRLGYYNMDHFSYPGDVRVILYAYAGPIPDAPMPCQAKLDNTPR